VLKEKQGAFIARKTSVEKNHIKYKVYLLFVKIFQVLEKEEARL